MADRDKAVEARKAKQAAKTTGSLTCMHKGNMLGACGSPCNTVIPWLDMTWMRHTAVEFLDMRVKKTDATKPTDSKAPLKMAPAAAANKGPYPVPTYMLPLFVLLGHKLEVHRDMMPCVS